MWVGMLTRVPLCPSPVLHMYALRAPVGRRRVLNNFDVIDQDITQGSSEQIKQELV